MVVDWVKYSVETGLIFIAFLWIHLSSAIFRLSALTRLISLRVDLKTASQDRSKATASTKSFLCNLEIALGGGEIANGQI